MGVKKPASAGHRCRRRIRRMLKKIAVSMLLLIVGQVFAAELDLERFSEDAKAALVASYKDPESAQFRGTFIIKYEWRGMEVHSLCGEVNAKNSYGAYVGFTPFYVDRFPNGNLAPSPGSEIGGNHPIAKDMRANMVIDHCTSRTVQRLN